MKNIRKILATLGLVLFFSTPAFAGRIVAFHDEWALSNLGFTQAGGANGSTFAQNLATYLKGGAGAGNFLIYSDNNAFDTAFQNALTAAGHTVTFLLSTNPLPADLSPYSGIFLSGLPGNANSTTLTNYVNSGKGVYVAAGNSYIPDVEANRWNAFLQNFGLAFSTTYNGIQGVFSVASSSPIFTGVSQLYHDNGNDVGLYASSPYSSIVLYGPGSQGIAGVYDSSAPVPEPATMTLLGLAALGSARRKRKLAK